MADLPQTPELIAVIRSSKKTLIVVKRGEPVHVSEVVPEALEQIVAGPLAENLAIESAT
jgi:hypothetical protein